MKETKKDKSYKICSFSKKFNNLWKFLKDKYFETNIKLKKITDDFKTEHSYLIKPLLILALIYIIGIFAIMRADFNYIDDLGRKVHGYRGWDNFSRFISQYLSIFIHGGKYLSDISPLPQILAVIVMSFASIIILHIFCKEKKKVSVANLIAVTPLCFTPYFLECLSYKFDAIYMAISIFASVFPILFYDKGNIKYLIVTVIGTLVMTMTYQASSGIFPILVIFISFKLWNNREKPNLEILKLIVTSMIGYLIGLLIFKLFIMVPIDSYVSNTVLSYNEIFTTGFAQLKSYYLLLFSDFKNLWKYLIIIILICFIVLNIMVSKQKKYMSFIVLIILITIMLVLAFGLYPFLNSPLKECRAMYGISIVISILCIGCTNNERLLSVIPCAFVLLLAWCFLSFSFTYGNALAEQKRYTEYKAQEIIVALNELKIFDKAENVQLNITGNIGKSPVLNNAFQVFPILSRLVPTTVGGGWVWNTIYLLEYYDINNKINSIGENWDSLDLQILSDTTDFMIKGDETHCLIILK